MTWLKKTFLKLGQQKPHQPQHRAPESMLARQIALSLADEGPFNSLADLAQRISHIAHTGQMRASGAPYTSHTDYVGNGLNFTDEEKAIGYLHDVLEDTDLTESDLLYLGIPKDVVDDIVLVSTNLNGRGNYFESLIEIMKSPRALKIKRRDIEHNFSSLAPLRPDKGLSKTFQYGLALNLFNAAEKDPEWINRNIIDFVRSSECPANLKDLKRLKRYTQMLIPTEPV